MWAGTINYESTKLCIIIAIELKFNQNYYKEPPQVEKKLTSMV